jgi:HK97 family phage prohead protease
MTQQTDLERRAADVAADGAKIRGVAVVFDTPSQDLGGIVEIITPEAVDRTLKERLDVRALVDHDPARIIGRTKAGTLTLEKRRDGLHVSITPPDTTTGRDILESVRRGDVTGMSFSFRVLRPHGERFEKRGHQLTRIVSDMRILEVSLTTFPAYESTDAIVAQRAALQYSLRSTPGVAWRRLELKAR